MTADDRKWTVSGFKRCIQKKNVDEELVGDHMCHLFVDQRQFCIMDGLTYVDVSNHYYFNFWLMMNLSEIFV